jgi:hypothetical protein
MARIIIDYIYFMKKIEQFYLVIKDNDTKEFNVAGPMLNDTGYTNMIVEEQKKGRNVTCASTNDVEGSITTFVDSGYKYVPEKRLLSN